MASTQQYQHQAVGQAPLPWELIREELRTLAPGQFAMIDFMLSDIEHRAPTLSDRDQIHEFLIVVLSSLIPGFPQSRERLLHVN